MPITSSIIHNIDNSKSTANHHCTHASLPPRVVVAIEGHWDHDNNHDHETTCQKQTSNFSNFVLSSQQHFSNNNNNESLHVDDGGKHDADDDDEKIITAQSPPPPPHTKQEEEHQNAAAADVAFPDDDDDDDDDDDEQQQLSPSPSIHHPIRSSGRHDDSFPPLHMATEFVTAAGRSICVVRRNYDRCVAIVNDDNNNNNNNNNNTQHAAAAREAAFFTASAHATTAAAEARVTCATIMDEGFFVATVSKNANHDNDTKQRRHVSFALPSLRWFDEYDHLEEESDDKENEMTTTTTPTLTHAFVDNNNGGSEPSHAASPSSPQEVEATGGLSAVGHTHHHNASTVRIGADAGIPVLNYHHNSSSASVSASAAESSMAPGVWKRPRSTTTALCEAEYEQSEYHHHHQQYCLAHHHADSDGNTSGGGGGGDITGNNSPPPPPTKKKRHQHHQRFTGFTNAKGEMIFI